MPRFTVKSTDASIFALRFACRWEFVTDVVWDASFGCWRSNDTDPPGPLEHRWTLLRPFPQFLIDLRRCALFRQSKATDRGGGGSPVCGSGCRNETNDIFSGRWSILPGGAIRSDDNSSTARSCFWLRYLVPASKLMRVAHLKSRQSRHLWSAQWNRTALSCIRWRPLGTSDVLHWGMENPISSATHISARKVLHRHRSARVIPLRMNFCGFFFSLFFSFLSRHRVVFHSNDQDHYRRRLAFLPRRFLCLIDGALVSLPSTFSPALWLASLAQ